MKININIEVSPSELIELQDVVHESTREVVAKLSGKDMARKILEHLEETSNQTACHIPADHMETGTVIQGKPPREPDAGDVIQPGDRVKWLSKAEAEATPPRQMRDPGKRIQVGTQVIIQPFTGHNEIFTVLYAGDKRAIVRGENGEFNAVDLSELLRVWPDPESTYGVYCGAVAVEPPEE